MQTEFLHVWDGSVRYVLLRAFDNEEVLTMWIKVLLAYGLPFAHSVCMWLKIHNMLPRTLCSGMLTCDGDRAASEEGSARYSQNVASQALRGWLAYNIAAMCEGQTFH